MSESEKDNRSQGNVVFEKESFVKTHPLPSYDGEVCIVTGGSTGIGAATCEAFVQAGAMAVYNLDITHPAKEDSSSSSSSNKIHFVECDVSKPDALKKAMTMIYTKHERIDHLVSNAGVWCGGEEMEDITETEFDRVVGINVKGCFFAISSVIPFMKKQQQPQGGSGSGGSGSGVSGGSIVIIGSDQSFVGKSHQNLYGMTKGAIAQLAKSCAVQYAPDNIRVNCVCPGTIDTPLMRKAVQHMTDLAGDGDVEGRVTWLQTAQPYPRLGAPEEIAHTVAFVSKMPFMVGAQVAVDGGYTCQ